MIRKGIALLLTLAAVMTLWGSAQAEEAKQKRSGGKVCHDRHWNK